MSNHKLTWLFKTCFVSALIMACNYPLAFAICHDVSPTGGPTLLLTISVISLLYGFSILCGPHHFHALLIGLLAGNLISVLTWIASFRDIVFHFTDQNKLSVFYCFGVFIPATIHFYISMRHDSTETKSLHRFLTTAITSLLFIFLIHHYFTRKFHDSVYFSLFHFSLGILVGVITAGIIHFVISRNLLVFQKLSLYLKVMLKPILAFFLGYILIMFTFTGVYVLAYYKNHNIFSHLHDDVFGDLMFYSFSTITGLGFSVITPEKPITLLLTTIENFLGLVWMSVVFAAALAHLQVPFRRISIQLDRIVKDEDQREEKKKA